MVRKLIPLTLELESEYDNDILKKAAEKHESFGIPKINQLQTKMNLSVLQ